MSGVRGIRTADNPTTITVITSDDPSWYDNYNAGINERWTLVTAKDAVGGIIATETIAMTPGEIVMMVGYQKTTYDGYTYLKYETDQVREIKFPHKHIATFDLVEIVL
jgi:hypothetical protein